jgi:ubiquinol-cytochrome c reductase cytochrome c subunit
VNRSIPFRFLASITVLLLASVLILARQAEGTDAAKSAAKADTPAGNSANGKRIYKSYGCYQCHGYDGQGGSGSGPRLAPPVLQLKAFSAYVRQPKNQMPPYTIKVVSEAEMADMYAFLQSLPKPPALKSVPLLNE